MLPSNCPAVDIWLGTIGSHIKDENLRVLRRTYVALRGMQNWGQLVGFYDPTTSGFRVFPASVTHFRATCEE